MIKALIIEDETHLRELLKILIKETDEEVNIIAECDNIQDAETVIQELQPDLIFLDVVMPGGTGFDLLERIAPISCEVIFITAHDSFAVEAFKHSAIGYVLKPVDKQDLKAAIVNAKRRIKSEAGKNDVVKFLDQLRGNDISREKIALPVQDGFVFVAAQDIIRCESDKVYTWIYLQNGKSILCSYNIGEFRRILPEHSFFQVHKSHIISLRYVKSYNGRDNLVELTDGSTIPVSRRNKISFLGNFKLPARNE